MPWKLLVYIEENGLLLGAKAKGEKIRQRLSEIKERFGVIKEVRGRGLMIAIEFEKNNNLSFAGKINEELLKRNIILVRRPGIVKANMSTVLSSMEARLVI